MPKKDPRRDGDETETDSHYGLVCRSCPFARTVEGLDPALEWMDRHKTETDDSHSVDVYAFGYLADLAAERPAAEATELERRAMALVTPDESATGDRTVDGVGRGDADHPDERTAGDD